MGTSETVSAIFGGKCWLNGVLRSRFGGPSISTDVVKAIRHPNHYTEIRVIFLHRDLLNDGAETRSLETGKPVIALGFQAPLPNSLIPIPSIAIATGEKTAIRILKIT